jgi:drug/metabolite transporter (DMT)-like permease
MRVRFRQVPAAVLGGGQVLASLVVMLPFALLTEGIPTLSAISLQSWLGMLVAALSAPVAAYWLLIYIVNKHSASLGGFAGVATPVFSVLIGVLFLREVITAPIAIGTLFLIAGVLTIQYF